MKLTQTYKTLLLFVLFSGQILFGQKHVLIGKVVSSADGKAISSAVVEFPDLHRNTTCDDNGNFTMRDIPGSSQVVSVSRLGYHNWVGKVALMDSIVQFTFKLEPSGREEEEVVVFGTMSQSEDASATSIASLSQRGMRSRGALSISDGVSRLPGVSQLSTGAGISKPVIRGMYGNRIQTILLGMRFDNQQWQDEHGLGLNDIGTDRVEVIKGPAALMYGSEAMGGVINVIEERPADVDSFRADISTRLFSSTYGVSTDAGVRSTKAHHFYRLRIGYESHADYSDGNNKRILNSRFNGYVGKTTFGFDKKNWVCVNNYLFSKSDFGFIMDTSSFMKVDDRLARSFENPHHTVYINMFTSKNSFFYENGDVLRIVTGFHVNRRMEDEGGSGISLDMQLITAELHVQHEHTFSEHWIMTNGIQSQFQDNKNFGVRIIVPDARLSEASAYSYHRFVFDKAEFEVGGRFDFRRIQSDSLPHPQVAPPVYLAIVDKNYLVANGSAGTSIAIVDDLHFKVNFTSGYRTPNLAELQSNGVHEGTLHYEVGDPGMKVEQNFCAEAGLNFESEHFEFSVTAFDDRFLNYIYLIPTADTFYGFHIYKFIQTNATLQGGEAALDFSPIDLIDLNVSYSTIRAKTDQGNYLPFIPADKMEANLKFELGDHGKLNDAYVNLGGQYCAQQDRPAQFETETPSYFLLNASAGTQIKCNRGRMMTIDVCGNNLLNEKYFDHLSRFKEYNIYNIGRNISLNFKYEF